MSYVSFGVRCLGQRPELSELWARVGAATACRKQTHFNLSHSRSALPFSGRVTSLLLPHWVDTRVLFDSAPRVFHVLGG